MRDIASDEHAEGDELDPWRLDAAHVAARLGTDVRCGLTSAEAQARRGRYGPNELEPEAAVPAWRKLLSQFANPLVYVLLAAVPFPRGDGGRTRPTTVVRGSEVAVPSDLGEGTPVDLTRRRPRELVEHNEILGDHVLRKSPGAESRE